MPPRTVRIISPASRSCRPRACQATAFPRPSPAGLRKCGAARPLTASRQSSLVTATTPSLRSWSSSMASSLGRPPFAPELFSSKNISQPAPASLDNRVSSVRFFVETRAWPIFTPLSPGVCETRSKRIHFRRHVARRISALFSARTASVPRLWRFARPAGRDLSGTRLPHGLTNEVIEAIDARCRAIQGTLAKRTGAALLQRPDDPAPERSPHSRG